MRGYGRPGEYNSRILLLVDGHRMNDNIYNQAFLGNDFNVDVDLIDRVEVIRGAGSSLCATNAFVGIINVKTKSGEAFKGAEVAAEGGRFASYKGRVTYGDKFAHGLDLLISGSRSGSRGDERLYYPEFNDPTTYFGIARRQDSESAGNVFGRLSYGDFALEGGYISRDKDIPTASFDAEFNADSFSVDKRGFFDLKYDHEFANGLGLRGRLFYDSLYYRGKQVTNYGGPVGVQTNRDIGNTQGFGDEWQLTKTVFDKHKLIFGGEYRYSYKLDQRNFDVEEYLNEQRTTGSWALFLQDDFEILKTLRLNAGVRCDRYYTVGGTVNPRVALIYQPVESSIFKLIYGQAFRAPNAYELYWSSPGATKANSSLKPETIRNVEFLYQQLLGPNVWATANIYYHRIRDLITQETDPEDGLLVYRNMGRVTGRGLELEVEGRWGKGLHGRLSYTLQQTQSVETDKVLANSPTHLIKLNGSVPLYEDKLFLGLEQQFTSDRVTLAGKQARDYFLTNVTLSGKNFLKGLQASASVFNLTNRKYDDPAGGEHRRDKIQQDGRSFWLKLLYKF